MTDLQTIIYLKDKASVHNSISHAKQKKELYQVDLLRVIASVGVCLYHFTCGNGKFLDRYDLLYQPMQFGYLGVNIFFVVSGLIICYSFPENYQIKNFVAFFKKRLLRIHPPYLMSIALTVITAYAAAKFTYNPVPFSWLNLLYHFFYLSNFTNVTYINEVYWTLGIEFQFYILLGLLFSWMRKSLYHLSMVILFLLALNWINIAHTHLIFKHTPLFCTGILMYFILFNYQYPKEVLLGLLTASLTVLAYHQPASFYVSLFTICVIYMPFVKNAIIQFLSGISYSLYLVHIPVGGRVINLCLHFTLSNYEKYLAILLALVASIITAYFFHLLIEKPAIRWSKKINYFRAG